MSRISSKLIFFLLVCSWLIQPAFAVKIVRLELEYGSDTIVATGGFDIPKTNTILDIELYDDVAPITVANYLNYVRSGRYDLTFINRSIPGFVLQTGGVTNISDDPENEALSTSFGEVEEFPPIVNEPGLSNIRGTIAMAKTPEQPNSANSEWFINLQDNSNPLDTDNGGFTVFGSIIDDGMEIADQVETFPVFDISFLFGSSYFDLPLADINDFSSQDPTQSNLVMILTATEISRPILRFSPADSDFGIDITGDAIGKLIDVVLKNTGNEIMDIKAISIGALNAPFSILSEDCSNASLEPVLSSSCTVSFQFLAEVTGVFNDSLVIDYTSQKNGNSFSVKYSLIGQGSDIGVPEIDAADTFEVGTSQVGGYSATKYLVVKNVGQAPLQISAITITGLSATNFSQTNECISNGNLIAPGEVCNINVIFTTNEFGAKIATLSIESDDPLNNTIDIELTGFGDDDSDGIVSAIENASPNAGDNNIDGISDSQQNNVASFTGKTDIEYISLIVNENHIVASVLNIPEAQYSDKPVDVDIKHGIFEYEVIVNSPGASIEVGLILPAGQSLVGYYIFGETPDNTIPHWYSYPAVQVFTNASSENGSARDFIRLIVQDGGAGDADQEINGRIKIGPGAPVYSLNGKGDSGTGSMNQIFIGLYLMLLVCVFRRCGHIYYT